MQKLLLLICITAGILLLAMPVALQGEENLPVTDDTVNEIAEKLYCPVCENITLDACGTAACADWRYEIRLQLEDGKTEQQIIEDFVMRFGDRVVGTPLDPALRGLSLYTPWLVMAGVLIGGAIFLSRSRSVKRSIEPASEQTLNRYQELFEQDVRNS
jgi:cytochrome c-type biogenesis protein CcmH